MVNNLPIWAQGSDPDLGVCMKVRFKYKVTRSFPFSQLRGFLSALSFGEKSREERNQGKPPGPGQIVDVSSKYVTSPRAERLHKD